MKLKRALFIMTMLLLITSSAFAAQEITLTADTNYSDLGITGDAVINGGGFTLALPTTFSAVGNLKIQSAKIAGATTIYAAGYTLEITSDVTNETALTVYGGGNETATESTDLRIYGGYYSKIYGGGKNSGGAVSGNTNVIVGGEVNSTYDTDDDGSNCSPLTIYGGGSNSTVGGSTNVTLEGNAVAKYIYGASGGGSNLKESNVYIKGGAVMNAFGGGGTLNNCNTNVIMTGGTAEALFGGSSAAAMTGNANVVVKGGTVTRRIFGGCYNNATGTFSYTWSTKHYVTGTTTITLYPGVSLMTGSDVDKGVYGGSRVDQNYAAEYNSIIFLNDAYDTLSGKIKTTAFLLPCKSYHDYRLDAGAGGVVTTSGTGGAVYIQPDEGKYALYSDKYYINENATLSGSSVNTMTFDVNFALSSLSAAATSTGADVTVGFVAKNVKSLPQPKLLVAIYESGTETMVGADVIEPAASATSNTFSINAALELGKTYTAKAMLWDGNLVAQTLVKETTFSK